MGVKSSYDFWDVYLALCYQKQETGTTMERETILYGFWDNKWLPLCYPNLMSIIPLKNDKVPIKFPSKSDNTFY